MADDLRNGFFQGTCEEYDSDGYSHAYFDAAFTSSCDLQEAQVGLINVGHSELDPGTDSMVKTQDNWDASAPTHQEMGQTSTISGHAPSPDAFEQNQGYRYPDGNFPPPVENTNNIGVLSEASHRQNPSEGVHIPTMGTGFDTFSSYARTAIFNPSAEYPELHSPSFTSMQPDLLSQELNRIDGGRTLLKPVVIQWEGPLLEARVVLRQQTDDPWCPLMATLPPQPGYTQINYEGSSGQQNQPYAMPWNTQPPQMPNTPSIVVSYQQPGSRILPAGEVNPNQNGFVLDYGSVQNPLTDGAPLRIAFNGIDTNTQASNSLELGVFTENPEYAVSLSETRYTVPDTISSTPMPASPALSSVASETSSIISDPLRCLVPGCRVEFTGQYRRGNLGRHEKSVHRLPNYPCDFNGCDKTYKRSDARKIHKRKKHTAARAS